MAKSFSGGSIGQTAGRGIGPGVDPMQAYAQRAVTQQARLQERVNKQIRARQLGAEQLMSRVVRGYEADPMLAALKKNVTEWMEAPGISPETVTSLQQRARAMAAADVAAGGRSIRGAGARLGMRGAQITNLLEAARARGSRAATEGVTDIAFEAQRMREASRGAAYGMGSRALSDIYGMRMGMAGQQAALLTSYAPQVAQPDFAGMMQAAYSRMPYGQGPGAPYPYQTQQPMTPAGMAAPAAPRAPVGRSEAWQETFGGGPAPGYVSGPKEFYGGAAPSAPEPYGPYRGGYQAPPSPYQTPYEMGPSLSYWQ